MGGGRGGVLKNYNLKIFIIVRYSARNILPYVPDIIICNSWFNVYIN